MLSFRLWSFVARLSWTLLLLMLTSFFLGYRPPTALAGWSVAIIGLIALGTTGSALPGGRTHRPDRERESKID